MEFLIPFFDVYLGLFRSNFSYGRWWTIQSLPAHTYTASTSKFNVESFERGEIFVRVFFFFPEVIKSALSDRRQRERMTEKVREQALIQESISLLLQPKLEKFTALND